MSAIKDGDHSNECPTCHHGGKALEVRLEPDTNIALVFDTPPSVRVLRACLNSNCNHRYYVHKHVTDLSEDERTLPLTKGTISDGQVRSLLKIVDKFERTGRWDRERVGLWKRRIMAWPATSPAADPRRPSA